jgi:hypothetical protein
MSDGPIAVAETFVATADTSFSSTKVSISMNVPSISGRRTTVASISRPAWVNR